VEELLQQLQAQANLAFLSLKILAQRNETLIAG
jgi:hypothetical protein